MDWDKLWDQLGDAVNNGLTDIERVGVPALQSSLELWGIQVLTEQNKTTQAALDANLSEFLNRPSQPGSFGASVSSVLQNSIVKEYGAHIAIGVAALVAVGFILARKG